MPSAESLSSDAMHLSTAIELTDGKHPKDAGEAKPHAELSQHTICFTATACQGILSGRPAVVCSLISMQEPSGEVQSHQAETLFGEKLQGSNQGLRQHTY